MSARDGQDAAAAAEAALGPCARIVRRMDRDRFLTAVTAPADRRDGLFALYAFNAEVAKTREAVSEAMLGEIRLQWWREAIAECFAGTPRRHEVIGPLAEAIRAHGPDRALFDALIDARARDLDDTPLPDLNAFEDYAVATSGGVIRLAAQLLEAEESEESVRAANDVGVAYALVGAARALPFTLAAKRTLLPASLFAEAGVDDATLYRAKPDAGIGRAVLAALDEAERRLARARGLRGAVPREAVPAFLAARIAASSLKQLRRAGGDPFDARLATPPALRPVALAWAARTGRW